MLRYIIDTPQILYLRCHNFGQREILGAVLPFMLAQLQVSAEFSGRS